jgi:hypothetical protein
MTSKGTVDAELAPGGVGLALLDAVGVGVAVELLGLPISPKVDCFEPQFATRAATNIAVSNTSNFTSTPLSKKLSDPLIKNLKGFGF